MISKILARLAMWRNGLRSAPLRERLYPVKTADGRTLELQHSRFNLDWPAQLGINPRLIVELGAYDGGDAWRFRHRYPQARVVTVEADPDRIVAVRSALEGTGAEVHNFAACDTDGPVEWYPAAIDGTPQAQGSIFRHTEAYRRRFPFVDQAEDPVTVEGRRFDSFCAAAGLGAIDLLHMDIEGAEVSVLRSMGDLRPRLIYLEWREGSFVGHQEAAEAAALLGRMGYHLVADLGDDRLYRHEADGLEPVS